MKTPPVLVISIPEHEMEESFIRSSGPGGQNVNKVASAVQLRFDIWKSASLDPAVKHRLIKLAGRRVNTAGVLVITARAHRDQVQNRAEARARLAELITRASVRPKARKKTRPTAAARQRRLTGKLMQGRKKQQRRSGWEE